MRQGMLKELKQLHVQELRLTYVSKRKRDGKTKTRICTERKYQGLHADKKEKSSPTVYLEATFQSCMMDSE